MTEVSIALAFAAGLISFVSPCVLALLPVYLAFLGDAAVTDGSGARSGGTAVASRAAILPQALLFVGGFSAVFVVLGTSIGIVGGPLFRVPEIRQLAGIAVIILGLLTTGIFGPVLDRFSVALDPADLPAARSARSLALGAFVAVGWTPCIGPVLGAIFTMGASSGCWRPTRSGWPSPSWRRPSPSLVCGRCWTPCGATIRRSEWWPGC